MKTVPGLLLPNCSTLMERSCLVLSEQWGALLDYRRSVLKTPDLDSIHDLRVASRRFRAALELYYPLIDRCSKKGLRKKVRRLTRVLGGLRNIDEAHIFFKQRIGGDTKLGMTIRDSFFELRSKRLQEVVKALNAFDQAGCSRIVRKIIADIKAKSTQERDSLSLVVNLFEASIRLFLPVQNSLAGSTVPENRELRHALRISIKKWRYFLEIITRLFNCDCSREIESLKEYQAILGRMNDIAEFELLLSGSVGLSVEQEGYLITILAAEDDALLENYTALTRQKPLVYLFPVQMEAR